MNPLCTLRYSATHADKHHMVYRLDAVDAYERKLVKQIEVAAAAVEGGHNKPYVRLLSVSNKRGVITAKVELDVQTATGVQRRESDRAGRRRPGADHRAGRLPRLPGGRNPRRARATSSWNCAYPAASTTSAPARPTATWSRWPCSAQMIRRTIKEHLDKEKRLRPQGIKVLSLFFIDAVEKYRKYDADGNPVKGDYARIFEEEYRRLAKHPDYQTPLQGSGPDDRRRGGPQRLFLHRQEEGRHARRSRFSKTPEATTKADDDTYNLIMRDKEKLLSFDTPLKFIFSHSALREGWDNPNVFQICALREMGTERERRQTIGRGLRLCVNQQGERLRGFEVNTLTVIATESYEQFAENLQKEIEEETGIRFGIVETHQFAGSQRHGSRRPDPRRWASSSRRCSGRISRPPGYVNAQGKVQDTLRQALKDGTLTLPEPFAAQLPQVKEILRKLAGRLEIKNADERKQVKTRQAVLQSAEFKALWDRIKHKTTYRVQFDNEALLADLHPGDQGRVRPSPRPACNGARPTSPSAGPAWTATETAASAPVDARRGRHRTARHPDRPPGQDSTHPPQHPAHSRGQRPAR